MPLVETLPVGTDTRQWPVWGTVARVVTDDPAYADDAEELVRGVLADVDQACSRFRDDSEIRCVARALGRPVRVSEWLRVLVATALDAARATGGDVDPTVGTAMCALGYDRDFAALTNDRTGPLDSTPAPLHPTPERSVVPLDPMRDRPVVRLYPAPDWRAIRLDGNELTVPAGVELDLGATAKAWAADRAAALVTAECRTGVLVALGGDIATAGRPWSVLVQDGPGEPASTVVLPAGAALATSSTISRACRHGGRALHHILDPRTGAPAPRVWRTASVAAFDCVRANTLSTAALVRGRSALRLLRAEGAPARLVAADGTTAEPGTFLATVSGPLARPGVYEVPLGIALGDLFTAAGGQTRPVRAVLVGGYHGVWVPPDVMLPLSRDALASYGAGPGAGVVMALAAGTCGVAASARIAAFRSDARAGHCGPCVNGLPRIATAFEALARRVAGPAEIAALNRLAQLVTGRGACRHPDGTARFVRSSLHMFAADVRAHAAGWCTEEGNR